MNRLTPAPVAWRLLRLAGDLGAAAGAFYLSFLARIHLSIPLTAFPLPAGRMRFFGREWWMVVASQALALYFFGFYDPPRESRGPESTRRLLAAIAFQGVGLAGYYFLTDRQFPRSVLVLFVVFNFVLVLAWRSAVRRLYRAPRRRVAIVGCGPAARELAAKIAGFESQDVEVVGFVPAPDEAFGPPEEGADLALGRLLGRVEDLPALLAAGTVDDIILAAGARAWQTRLLDQLATQRPAGSNVLLLPGPIESLIGRMRYRWVDDVPLIEVVRQSEWRVNRPVKRLMDLALAILMLPVALPLLLLGSMAVALGSRGPVFYRQERLGLGRRRFTVWKLRTMRPDAERFSVPPGLTGLAQVNGDYHSTPENKLRYDLAYIANWSPLLDLAILFRTVKIVLTSRGT